jgi:hypothetical protein
VCINEPKRDCWLVVEEWSACAYYDGADHQVEFVNQTMGQQVVPECAAAKDQDVFAVLAFEFGNLRVRVCAADDAGGMLPRFRLLSSCCLR